MSNKLQDISWVKQASCLKTDVMESRVFFSFHPLHIIDAKGICRKCPVKGPCAKKYGDSLFVVAGKTKYERLLEKWHRISSPDEDNFG